MIPFNKTPLAVKIGTVMTGIVLLSACGGGGSGSQARTLSFEGVEAPATDLEKRQVLASSTATVKGEDYSIGYHTLLRSGDSVDNNVVFGQLVDELGQPLYDGDGSPQITDSNEHTSLLPIGDRLFSVSQMETAPGAMFLIELNQDKENGLLSPKKLWQIDQSGVNGGWVHCAASVTPWNTHLASEEYEPDAASDGSANRMASYFGNDTSKVNPYFWGWNIEVAVSAEGDQAPTTNLAKHYAMGRLAFELSYVMPDSKTAYMSDDGTNVGLYMFVADDAGDLSAGTLYAAKWNQTSGEGLGSADLEWISLGHASDEQIKPLVEGGNALTFDDIFTTGTATDDVCEDGFTGIKANGGTLECLKVNDGMEMAASRLEARRYAAIKGATTEFRKEEGITFDPDGNHLYVSMSSVGKGMLDNGSQDLASANHIRLEGNGCGGVYQLDMGTDTNIGSKYVATSMRGLIAGIPTDKYSEDSPYASYTCDKDGIANPDNITFITGYNTLMIGEDTGSGHQNDVVWALNLDEVSDEDHTAGLTRVQTTPYGAESTSLYWYPNINGFGYLMSVVQHPYGESDRDELAPGSLDHRAYTGYVGPFPAMDQ